MTILDRHDRANEAIRALDAALARSVESGSPARARSRPASVQPIPDVDYGSRSGCDRALTEVRRRLDQFDELTDGSDVDDPRVRAEVACRELAEAILRHRSDLGVVGAEDDDAD